MTPVDSTKTVPWDSLTKAEQEPYLRDARDYVSQDVYREDQPDVTPEEFEYAVQQTAEENYYAACCEKLARNRQSLFRKPTIEEQAQRLSAVLGKQMYAYREPHGLLVLTAAPLPRAANLVDKGRKISLRPKDPRRISVSRGPAQRILP